MMMKKNDDIELTIEDMTSEGSAVGHYNGIAVFVRGAVTGDKLIAHIIKVSKRYAIGIVKEIMKPSPARIISDCDVSERCGGCSFRNMSYEEEIRYKKKRVADAIMRIGHIDTKINDVVFADRINHYRNKAQYPVSMENGKLAAGFYAFKSHRVIPCTNCILQPEEFSDILNVFLHWADENNITAYDEKTGRGLLRHIYIRKAFATGEVMVCAVINDDSLPNGDRLIDELKKIREVKSVCYNVNRADTNVILGNTTKVLYGSETITDRLLGKSFVISPESFYQVNHDQCEKLYSKAMEYAMLTGEETVVDLYCGAGTIGLTMADQAKKVFGIEIVPQAIENAKMNAKINEIHNAEFFCGDAFAAAKELGSRGITPDVVILDPPRKGCQRELFDVIGKMSPQRIVYVSCDASTLARDLAVLEDKGYKTLEVTPFDLFPRTPHVECVALLSKTDKSYCDKI